jgi:cobalt-zinc-cadmium efflux system outer membrane protein
MCRKPPAGRLFSIALSGALLATAAAPALKAQQALGLDEVLAIALRENRDLAAAHARTAAARADLTAARAYPNPSLSVAPGNPFQYSAAVPVDVGPRRTFRVRSASAGADAANFDRADTERQLRFSVRQAFFDLLLADSLQEVTRGERDIFADLLRADSARVRAGDAPARNLAKSELELARAEAALLQASADVRAARLALQALMGVARPDTGFRVSGSLSPHPLPALDAVVVDSVLLDSVMARRPDIGAAQSRTRASEAARHFATAQLLPVPQLALVHQAAEPFPNGRKYALGVSLEVPVWNWFSGDRGRAAASLAEARASEEQMRLMARADIATALDQFRSAAERARRFDAELLAKARGALDDARYAYHAGAISYVDLLDAVHTYGQVRADAFTAAHAYWIRAYALVRAANLDFD